MSNNTNCNLRHYLRDPNLFKMFEEISQEDFNIIISYMAQLYFLEHPLVYSEKMFIYDYNDFIKKVFKTTQEAETW